MTDTCANGQARQADVRSLVVDALFDIGRAALEAKGHDPFSAANVDGLNLLANLRADDLLRALRAAPVQQQQDAMREAAEWLEREATWHERWNARHPDAAPALIESNNEIAGYYRVAISALSAPPAQAAPGEREGARPDYAVPQPPVTDEQRRRLAPAFETTLRSMLGADKLPRRLVPSLIEDVEVVLAEGPLHLRMRRALSSRASTPTGERP